MSAVLNNATVATTTTAAYKIYVLNRDAVIGIIAGVCGGVPLLFIFCLCIHACTSKSKRPISSAGATLHMEPPKGALLQKFCDVKDRTLNRLKKTTKADGDEDSYRRKRSTLFAARDSTPSEVTPVTAFAENEGESKKKKSKSKSKKKSKKEEEKQTENDSEKKKEKQNKNKKEVELHIIDQADQEDELEAKTTKKANKKKKKSSKAVIM